MIILVMILTPQIMILLGFYPHITLDFIAFKNRNIIVTWTKSFKTMLKPEKMIN